MGLMIDVILDLSHGDSGKGKISHKLLSSEMYSHSLRFNGGANAGHTIYHKGKKFVTHILPAGVFYQNVRSIVGPGCVVDTDKFLSEIELIKKELGYTPDVAVAKNAHLVTGAHLEADASGQRIGTTKTGNGPAYAAKYARSGIRAEKDIFLKDYLVDMYEEFLEKQSYAKILAEGAQGFNLDIDWGNYPYVTSSHCNIGGLLNNGFNHTHIRKVYGVIKGYDTYVGSFKFESDNEPLFPKIRELGQEFGATTGRPRQVNWLNTALLKKAILMNGVTELVINKMDVLDELEAWCILDEQGKVLRFPRKEDFRSYLTEFAVELGLKRESIKFSSMADGSDLNF